MRMMAHPMLTQNLLPLKLPRNLFALTQNNELHRAMSYNHIGIGYFIKENQKPQGEDVDDTFRKLLVGQLNLIPECDLKDDLKINLQQMVLSMYQKTLDKAN